MNQTKSTSLELTELASLALTGPTLLICALVVFCYAGDASRRIVSKKDDPVSWLLAGICLSFAGSFFDNLYWGVAWFASYMRLDAKELLFDHGVVANVFFRQGAKIAAGFLHLTAATIYGVESEPMRNMFGSRAKVAMWMCATFSGSCGLLLLIRSIIIK